MSDPAIEAAQRAWEKRFPSGHPKFEHRELDLTVHAAREMADPIRELHQSWSSEACLPPEAWQILDELARLVYSTEELGS